MFKIIEKRTDRKLLTAGRNPEQELYVSESIDSKQMKSEN